LLKNWLNPSVRLLHLRLRPLVVLYKVGDRVLVDVMQRTTRPRVHELTISVSTIDVDQSAIRTPYADVDAPSLRVIDCDERPALFVRDCEGKAVALACSESQPCPIVEFAGLDEMDDTGGPAEFHHIESLAGRCALAPRAI